MYFIDCINHCLRDVAHVKISVCKNKRRLIERSIKIATDSIEVRHQVPTGKTKNYFFADCIKQTFPCMKLIFFCSFFFLLITVTKLIHRLIRLSCVKENKLAYKKRLIIENKLKFAYRRNYLGRSLIVIFCWGTKKIKNHFHWELDYHGSLKYFVNVNNFYRNFYSFFHRFCKIPPAVIATDR